MKLAAPVNIVSSDNTKTGRSAGITASCSVIIRTYNESRYLGQLLDAIKKQVIDTPVEVLVVDSGSTDDTLSIAREAGCKILNIEKAMFSFGRSLNMGCEAASNEILVFISGHCVPCDQKWLAALIAPIAEGEATISYGRQVGGPESKFSEHQLFEKYFPAEAGDPPHPYFCNNANAAISADSWRFFRFDEELTGLEDMDIGKKVIGVGGRIAYVPVAAVFHYHHEAWRTVKRRYEREAVALHDIAPSVHVTAGDAMRYFLAGVLGDSARALTQRVFIRHVAQIVAFRFCQYWGTWRGSNRNRHLSRRVKERYFYPS